MSFRDRDFNDRVAPGGMGDEAEGVFERVFPKGWVRYGLNRPPIAMHKLPARVRYSPDYLTTNAFVEVQGFGRDNVFKLKIDKWQSLHFWNSVHPVEIFVWDRTNTRWCLVTLPEIDKVIEVAGEIRHFPEGKSYMAIEGDVLFEHSHMQGEGDGQAA